MYRNSLISLLKKKNTVQVRKNKKLSKKSKKIKSSIKITRLSFKNLIPKFKKVYKKNDLLERPTQLSEFLKSCNTNCSWFINNTLDLMSKDLEYYNYDILSKNVHYNVLSNSNKKNNIKLRRKIVYKDLVYKKKVMLKKSVIKKKTTHFDYVTAKMLLSWKQYKYLYEQVSNFYQKELDWFNTILKSPLKQSTKKVKKIRKIKTIKKLQGLSKKKVVKKKSISKKTKRVVVPNKKLKKKLNTELLEKVVKKNNQIINLLTNYYFSLIEKKQINKKLLYRFNIMQQLALTYYTEFDKTEFYPYPLDGFISGRTIPTKSCYTTFDPSTFTMRFKHTDNGSLSSRRFGDMLIKSLRY